MILMEKVGRGSFISPLKINRPFPYGKYSVNNFLNKFMDLRIKPPTHPRCNGHFSEILENFLHHSMDYAQCELSISWIYEDLIFGITSLVGKLSHVTSNNNNKLKKKDFLSRHYVTSFLLRRRM